jgi:hypothetical protein
MKLHYIDEPLLEFGSGTHVCPRAGITSYEVYDTRLEARRDKIMVGGVGTGACLAKLKDWLGRCAQPIPGRPRNNKVELRPAFCGFNATSGYRAEFVVRDALTRPINNSDIRRLLGIERWQERVREAVELYYGHIEFLARYRVVDVIVCIIPDELYSFMFKKKVPPLEETLSDEDEQDSFEHNFRRGLKARAMHLSSPLQLMRELSLDSNVKSQQDDATKAWNFCTALYYKANKTVPWKMITDVNRPTVCYAGVGFYRSRDKTTLQTSLAQIFDELGNGVILRGAPVQMDKDDRVPHLSSEQAYSLLKRALNEYERALNTSPGRLVLHKSSNYTDEELDGFHKATDEVRVQTADFVTVSDSPIRLLRDGAYPPYRGMHIELDRETHILYTRGFVPFYKTYTGKYIPQPLEVRIVESDESPDVICREILALTKMNWNNTQFDQKYPITIGCARRVGEILKYLDENKEPQTSYSYYM